MINLHSTLMNILNNYGIFGFLFPAILIYSLTFLVVQSSGIFKTKDDDPVANKLAAAFSFGFTLMAIANQEVMNWMLYLIPHAMVWILGVFLFALAIALFVKPSSIEPIRIVIPLLSIIAIVAFSIYPMFTPSASIGGTSTSVMSTLSSILTPDVIAIIVLLATFYILTRWLTS